MRRSEEQRTSDGVPELRFGARGKGAAVGLPIVQRSSYRQLRDGADVVYKIAALQIRGLRQVGSQAHRQQSPTADL